MNAAVLESEYNLILLTDYVDWPSAESLPDDIRQICVFNGIK